MTTSPTLYLLSGGAAQGLFAQLRARFQAQVDARAGQGGCAIAGRFGAVGVMVDSLLTGADCDVVILTQSLIDQLTDVTLVRPGSARPLGIVKTGIAVKTGEPAPDVRTPAGLKAALLAASGIYFPDPVKATAGIHFMKVLQALGIDAELAPKLRTFPNGATAMREMAQSKEAGLMGCTQVTEILYTPGVTLIANLPKKFELATIYTAAVCSRAQHPDLAAELIELLSAQDTAQVRRDAGFE
jgi:molybdate transport system substrate-binding protein